ncbi:MAG: 50S ribosomal protein L4 [Chloroflexota bacterium]
MQLPVYNLAGEVVEQVELSDAIFGLPLNAPLLHQAVVRQLANKRQGTHSTKTRAMVAGSRKKMYRQKGTGRARHGNQTTNLYPGGGVTFGPHPRDYRQRMPKRMRQAALRNALSAKVADQSLVLLQGLEFEAPKTKQMVAVLQAFAVRSALVVLPESNSVVQKSTRNIPDVKTLSADSLNVLDVLGHRHLIMVLSAARLVEQALGRDGQAQEE